ncbi:MAG TPA: hypothetical protein VM711_08920, partial [Sphingomicrobium sp.]|nr:hypothetical protein [Sphingomicrobium sp.]
MKYAGFFVKLFLVGSLAALSVASKAQTVSQSGVVSPGHLGAWVTSGLVKDAGSPTNFQANALGLYNGANSPFAISSQTTSGSLPATYCTLALGATTTATLLTGQNQTGGPCPLNINIGGTIVPVGGSNWLSTNFDNQFCAAQGSVLYRNNAVWTCLPPGNSGQVLQTLGIGQNPQWAGSGGIGTVTSITAGTGLTGGTITSSGTIALSSPVSVANGGTASTTLTAHNVMLGEGTSAIAFAAPGVSGTCLTSNGVAADPTFQSCPGTGTVTSISAGTGISVSPSPITSSGAVTLSAPPNANLGAVQAPGGRLTLLTGTPVMAANETAKSTVYYDTYTTNYVPVYSGTAWTYLAITADEISMGLDSVTPHIALGSLYDVFGINNTGALAICAGPAWTNSTTRSTAIARQNGIWTNSTSMTHCYGGASGTTDYGAVSANTGTYLGTLYATANGQTGVAFTGSAAGGANNILGLYNAYNRVRVEALCQDSNSNWTSGSGAWQALDASTSNRISAVDGLAQSNVSGTLMQEASMSIHATVSQVGISANSTSATPALAAYGQGPTVSATGGTAAMTLTTTFTGLPLLGFNFYQAMQNQDATFPNTLSGNGLSGLRISLDM